MKILTIFFFLLVSTAIEAEESAVARGNDLCSSDEQVIFFCKAKHKIAGVCASKNLSNLTGFAQYRVFDIGKNMIEFVFPEKPMPPGRNFIMETQPLPSGIDVQIKFSHDGFLYIMHERDAPLAGGGFEGLSEILVKRDEEILNTINCLNNDSGVRRAGYESFLMQD